MSDILIVTGTVGVVMFVKSVSKQSGLSRASAKDSDRQTAGRWMDGCCCCCCCCAVLALIFQRSSSQAMQASTAAACRRRATSTSLLLPTILLVVHRSASSLGALGFAVNSSPASQTRSNHYSNRHFCSSTRLNTMSGTATEITFVTGNKKKAEEVARILAPKDGTTAKFVIVNKKLDLPELQGTPEEIALEKCKEASKEVSGPVITEDTCLCFNALSGLPGPYIKHFLEKTGHEGLNKMLDGFDDRSAYAQTIVAYCKSSDDEPVLFDGRTQGKIVRPRGPLDFGWDPVFEPDEGEGLTYAEMSKEGKDAISHRSRAMAKLRDHLGNEL